MPMKRYKPEQLLRQIEVEIANGKTTPQACRDAQITVQTFYRWRKEYDGLKLEKERMLHDQHPYTLSTAGRARKLGQAPIGETWCRYLSKNGHPAVCRVQVERFDC